MPFLHCFIQFNRVITGGLRGKVKSKIRHAERRRARPPVNVGDRTGHHPCSPLGAHHRVQASVALPVLNPELEFPEAEDFLRFCDGSAADAVEDEFTPDFVFSAEFVVFPRSLTS